MKIPARGNLHGRAVEEWVGRTPDSKPPSYVMDRILARQDGKCAISGRAVIAGDPLACDHIIPLKDGGRNAEANLQMILAMKHVEKTAAENKVRAKERRTRLKFLGLWPKSKRPLKGRPFPKRQEA